MSQRYDQPATASVRGSRDFAGLTSLPHAPSGDLLCGGPSDEGGLEPGSAAGMTVTGEFVPGEALQVGRGVSRGPRDFYSGARRAGARRGWMAGLRLDAYTWRAILLMLSFLAFGLIVSSFVLSL